MKPQLQPTNGNRRAAEDRRVDRVMSMLDDLPEQTQEAVWDNLTDDQRDRYDNQRRRHHNAGSRSR